MTQSVMTASSKKRLLRPDSHASGLVSGLLADVRVAAASIARFSLAKGGGLFMDGPPFLFVVLDGACWLAPDSGDATLLRAGDSILSLRGDPVRVAAERATEKFPHIAEVWHANGAPPVSYEGYNVPIDIKCGTGKPLCRMVGSVMTLTRVMASSNLVRDMPPVLLLRADDTHLDIWLSALQRMMTRERQSPSEGFAAIGAATAQLLLMQMLRTHLAENGKYNVGLVDDSRGHGIARVLRNLQRDPGRAWALADMARDAGMSRTSFSQHFGDVTGTTPFQYLWSCRMDYATELLENARQSVADIAALTGYRSERAFRSAFIQMHGIAPLAYRKQKTAERGLGG